ncbi:MAG: AmmeMemoRadiSam system protein B, partial [bacterium]
MDELNINPRLRVAPVPVQVEGKKMLLFQDPEGIVEESVLVPLEAAAIIQYFDGSRSVREIQEELTRQTGQLIDSDLIENLARQLDEKLLLDSPRFHGHVMKLNEEWAAQEVRPALHAGNSYPAEKEKLKKFLDGFYTAPDGPGGLPGERKASDLKGIVAPHMNINDSGACTAHAFKALAENTDASLFIIFGTAHMEEQRVFIMSDKDFRTPLGTARTDKDLVNRIARLQSNRNPLHDYIHKQEHSIEFMVVFLQHALADSDVRILPVLCNGFQPSVISETSPRKEPAFKDFMSALNTALSERNEKVCFIAGADLAHLGPRYGDQENYGPARMKEEEAEDRKMLDHLAQG